MYSSLHITSTESVLQFAGSANTTKYKKKSEGFGIQKKRLIPFFPAGLIVWNVSTFIVKRKIGMKKPAYELPLCVYFVLSATHFSDICSTTIGSRLLWCLTTISPGNYFPWSPNKSIKLHKPRPRPRAITMKPLSKFETA